jgi:hypothetical protein
MASFLSHSSFLEEILILEPLCELIAVVAPKESVCRAGFLKDVFLCVRMKEEFGSSLATELFDMFMACKPQSFPKVRPLIPTDRVCPSSGCSIYPARHLRIW